MENAKNTLMVNLNLILKLKEIIGKIIYLVMNNKMKKINVSTILILFINYIKNLIICLIQLYII